jgi:S-adenosylmethionine hydrolase
MADDASRIVTLTTDFGHKDPYVGVVKGIILSRFPQAQIVDLNHEIPPFDILAGAWSLKISVPYFKAGTIHIAVIDPRVGTKQRRIALELPDCIILAPDNGLTTPFIDGAKKAYALEKPQFFLNSVSKTFHARDVFAPVAARLLSGIALRELAVEVDKSSLTVIEGLEPKVEAGEIEGTIVYIDRYGNLITNFRAETKTQIKEIRIGSRSLKLAAGSYDTIDDGDAQVLCGSHGYLEIAAKEASAQALLKVSSGEKVTIKTG